MSTMYPPDIPESKPDPRVFSSQEQAFLVGDTIFLRGLEEEDARRASGWRDSPFPINAERAGELIKEKIEGSRWGQNFWVACRRSDGLPVGSVAFERYPGNDLVPELRLYADPGMPGRGQVEAEMLGLVQDWGFSEAELPALFFKAGAHQPELRARAESLGMDLSARWREQVWSGGAWHDALGYTAYNPAWTARLGRPEPGIGFALPVDDASRWRPREYPTYGTVDGDPPANAVMVGPRVYLRPLELEDGPGVVAGMRSERETFFDEGRVPSSTATFRKHVRSIAKEDPPTTIRFAVCLRENGRHIGSNGLWQVDYLNRTAETESFFHDPAARNQGYGSEAKHLLLAYAFERLGLHSVFSWVWGPNGRSAAALRKQGYRESGRVFWAGTKNADLTHVFCFDFLAEEWREMTARAAEPAAVGAGTGSE